jgi:hypothetical protein
VRSSESGCGVQSTDFSRNVVNEKYPTKVGTLNAASGLRTPHSELRTFLVVYL